MANFSGVKIQIQIIDEISELLKPGLQRLRHVRSMVLDMLEAEAEEKLCNIHPDTGKEGPSLVDGCQLLCNHEGEHDWVIATRSQVYALHICPMCRYPKDTPNHELGCRYTDPRDYVPAKN